MVNTRDGQVLSQDGDGVKIVKNKKSKAKQHNVSPLKYLADGGDNLVPCKTCSKEVENKGIQCDRCHAWLHQECTGLKPAQFKFLDENQIPGMTWHCQKCIVDADTENDEPDARFAQQEAKIDNLGLLISAVQQQQASFIQQQTVMQQQNQMILDLLNEKNNSKDSPIEDVIKNQFKEIVENNNEMKEKKNNLIFRNVPEKESDDDDENMEHDGIAVRHILNHIDPKVKIVKINRLGRPRPEGSAPRPIRITFNEQDRNVVLRNEKKMKDYTNFRNVRISRDKTRQEQEEDKKKYLECQKKREETKQDYIIFRGEIVLRENIPNIIKAQKSTREGQMPLHGVIESKED